MPKTRKLRGGKAIAAGGFGCVFKPALKCKNSNLRKAGVSKLMFKKSAEDEMKEVERITPILSRIPNHEKYFITQDISICTPAPLTASDLNNIKICNNFKKVQSDLVEGDNINKYINQLRSMDIPYGGDDLVKWIGKMSPSAGNISNLNKAMMDLIKNAIVPMNKKKLFHFDVKSDNILIDNNFNLKLIDWGLAGIQTGTEVPDAIIDRPFQFNVPFSNTLFNRDLNNWYDEQLYNKLHTVEWSPETNNLYFEKLKIISYNFINHIIEIMGPSHTDVIGGFIQDVFLGIVIPHTYPQRDNFVFNAIRLNVITEYLATIFDSFTDNSGVFLQEEYFNTAFAHNVDIWGALTVYLDLLHKIKSANNFAKKWELIEQIKTILIKYLYSSMYAAIPIPIDELMIDLEKINIILGQKSSIKKSTSKQVAIKNLGPPPGFSPLSVSSPSQRRQSSSLSIKNSRKSPFSWAGKRCPKGTRRNKKTNKCEYKN